MMESIKGVRGKAIKHKKDDRRKNRTFRGRRKEASEFQQKCYLCQSDHGYGCVSGLKMQM